MGAALVFKGGTFLSKAYGAIRRLSEDVDLTYDIRALVHDLVGDSSHPLPANRSQEKRWTREVPERLAGWTRNAAAPLLAEALRAVEARGEVRIENADLLVCYAPLNEGARYVRPEVKLEFGARATGEPNMLMSVACDAAPHVPGIELPKVEPQVMKTERTFWEKAAAVHVYRLQHRLRGERFARHCTTSLGSTPPELRNPPWRIPRPSGVSSRSPRPKRAIEQIRIVSRSAEGRLETYGLA